MAMIDEPTFRGNFPEFADTVKFPSPQVVFWLAQAYSTLNAARFGTNLDLAAMLFTAHNIVMSARDASASSGAGIPGNPSSVTASKAVGPVSISYDTTLTAIPGAGIWNATSYGQRFWRLLKLAGAGGLYVGGNPNAPPVNRYWPPAY